MIDPIIVDPAGNLIEETLQPSPVDEVNEKTNNGNSDKNNNTNNSSNKISSAFTELGMIASLSFDVTMIAKKDDKGNSNNNGNGGNNSNNSNNDNSNKDDKKNNGNALGKELIYEYN